MAVSHNHKGAGPWSNKLSNYWKNNILLGKKLDSGQLSNDNWSNYCSRFRSCYNIGPTICRMQQIIVPIAIIFLNTLPVIPSIIAVTETWLNSVSEDAFNILGYNFFSKSRGGGVGICGINGEVVWEFIYAMIIPVQ